MIEKTSKSYLIVSFLIVLVCWLEILIFWNKIPPQIPWFYSLPWGESQLMYKSGLIWLLGLTTIISFVTSYLPKWTKKDDVVIEKTIYIMTIIAGVLLLLSLTKVITIFIG